MGSVTMTMEQEPHNPTKFERGDVLYYKDCPSRFMVVGENDTYLHTFLLNGEAPGSYWGIFKAVPNLGALVRVEKGQSK